MRNRNEQAINILQVLAILLDGNPHTFKSFLHLKLHPKTIKRILRAFETIPDFKVRCISELKIVRWQCSFFKQDFKKIKIKECYKCDLISFEPVQDFYKDAQKYDGLQSICKKCKTKQHKVYQQKNNVAINRRRRYKAKLARVKATF